MPVPDNVNVFDCSVPVKDEVPPLRPLNHLSPVLSTVTSFTASSVTTPLALKAVPEFVQPTHFLLGIEYDKLKTEALAAAGYECPSILEKNRKLTFENPEKGVATSGSSPPT